MKLVILHESVQNETELIKSFKNDCVLRWEKDYDTIEKLLRSLDENLSYFTNLAFVYHYPGYCSLPFYTDNTKFLYESKLMNQNQNSKNIQNNLNFNAKIDESKYNYFSDNCIRLMEKFKVIDILSCNLNEPSYIEEVKKIESELNIDIRYSLNQTGNINSDWILESDGVDIRDLYFNEDIQNFTGVLAGFLNGVALENLREGDNWDTATTFITKTPNGTTGGFIYTLNRNITWNKIRLSSTTNINANLHFISLNTFDIFDGNGKTIDLAGVTTGGLFVTEGNSLNNCSIIKNLGIVGGSTLFQGGFFIRLEQKYFKVDNCYSTGLIGDQSGGIAGRRAGYQGSCEITNCYSIGNQSENTSGGIAGIRAGNQGSIKIVNCYSTGNILGGGIVGPQCGQFYGNCIIEKCYSTGNISLLAGGICGYFAGIQVGDVTINQCYSTGIIGIQAGGICGYLCVYANNVNILNSYSTGKISSNGGGITGSYCGDTCVNFLIKNCYSTGFIDVGAGGICGYGAGSNVNYGNNTIVIIENCYSIGDINNNAGGICGRNAGENGYKYSAEYPNEWGSTACLIKNCYSTGKIGVNGGGICGSGAGYGGYCVIQNCYSTGKVDLVRGGIFGSETGDSDKNTIYILGSYCEGQVAASLRGNIYVNSITTISSKTSPIPKLTLDDISNKINTINSYPSFSIETQSNNSNILQIPSSGRWDTTNTWIEPTSDQKDAFKFPILKEFTNSTFWKFGYLHNITTPPLNITLSQPILLSCRYSLDDCGQYSVLLLPYEGITTNYEYSLDNTNFSPVVTDTRFSLNADSYNITIRNVGQNNAIIRNLDLPVTPETFTANFEIINTDNGTNGKININITNGIIPFYYKINSETSYKTSTNRLINIENLSVGLYTIEIRDSSNCSFTKKINIELADEIFVYSNENKNIKYFINASDIFTSDGKPSKNVPFALLKFNSWLENLTFELQKNVTLTNNYFCELSNNSTFNGKNKTITLSGLTNFEGLFSNINSNCSVINLGVIGGTTSIGGGFIVKSDQASFKIKNCYSTGIINTNGGGICGESNNLINIDYSYSTGNINSNAGGICGQNLKNAEIRNCYSSGDLIGVDSGGICGISAGVSGLVRIENCYSLGNQNASYCGGICGSRAGVYGKCEIAYCYSTGQIGVAGGGICGFASGLFGNCIITDCFSSGAINNDGGGICGLNAGDSGFCLIQNCYSTGSIAQYAGGICGSFAGTNFSNGNNNQNTYNAICIIQNCYTTGIVSNGAGCICGYGAGSTSQADGQPVSATVTNFIQGTTFLVVQNCYGNRTINNIGQNDSTILDSIIFDEFAISYTAAELTIYKPIDVVHANLPLNMLDGINNSSSYLIPNRFNNLSTELNNRLIVCVANRFMDFMTGGAKLKVFKLLPWNNSKYTHYDLNLNINNRPTFATFTVESPATDIIYGYEYDNIFTATGNPLNVNIDNSQSSNWTPYIKIKLLKDLVIDASKKNNFCKLSIGGTFDGNNFIFDFNGATNIDGLFETSTSSTGTEQQKLNNASLVKNLKVISGTTSNGGGHIIRKNQSYFNIMNCSVNGTIQVNGGGICGQNSGINGSCLIQNCYFNGIIFENAGGIAGRYFENGKIINCYSSCTKRNDSGGIIGSDSKSFNIESCYSIGDILTNAGGICGSNSASNIGTIKNCFSVGQINSNAGGISGNLSQNLIIENCYSTGSILGGGGICGGNSGFNDRICIIQNCYSDGSLSQTSSTKSGGICGDNTRSVYIFNSYCNGKIIGNLTDINNSYYNNFDTKINSLNIPISNLNDITNNIITTQQIPLSGSLSSSVLINGTSYNINVKKWDINNIWFIPTSNTTDSDIYPRLRNFKLPPWDTNLYNLYNPSSLSTDKPQLTNYNLVLTNVSCFKGNNGSLEISTFDNTPLDYSIDGINYYLNKTSYKFENLKAGTFSIRVRLNNIIIDRINVEINQPAELKLTSTKSNVTINGGNNGEISLFASGGTEPYSYKKASDENFTNSNIFTGLTSGNYTFIVKDSKDCIINSTTIVINEPNVFEISSINITNISCFGERKGEISVQSTGGTGPYYFSIDNANYFIGQPNNRIFTNLAAGTYTIYAKDLSNKVINAIATIRQPDQLVFKRKEFTNLTSNFSVDGTITVEASGGVEPYYYRLQKSGDTSGAFVTSNSFTGLSDGNYTVIIKDANNCISQTNFRITKPDQVNITIDGFSNITCFNGTDGSISVSATGGSGNFNYKLNSGNFSNSRTFNSLNAGNYTITAKDSNNNEASINITLTQPNDIIINPDVKSKIGDQLGEAIISVIGGSGNFTYKLFSPGSNEKPGTTRTQTSNYFNNLPDNNYTVTVTDNLSGCIGVQVFNIEYIEAINTLREVASTLSSQQTQTTEVAKINVNNVLTIKLTEENQKVDEILIENIQAITDLQLAHDVLSATITAIQAANPNIIVFILPAEALNINVADFNTTVDAKPNFDVSVIKTNSPNNPNSPNDPNDPNFQPPITEINLSNYNKTSLIHVNLTYNNEILKIYNDLISPTKFISIKNLNEDQGLYEITDENNNVTRKNRGDDVLVFTDYKIKLGSVTGGFANTITTYGDPYITTLNGKVYKLPDEIATYRLFEGEGIIINAEVDYISDEQKLKLEKIEKELKNKHPNLSNLKLITSGVLYSKFYINNAGEEIIIDMKTKQIHKLTKVNTITFGNPYVGTHNIMGVEKSKCVKVPISISTNNYGKLNLELQFYENPQIENGIKIAIEKQNNKYIGLLVDTYKESDMKLNNIKDINTKFGKDYVIEEKGNVTADNEIWTK